jgi:class 3 adenylate cyclase
LPATHRTLATVLFTDIVSSTEALSAQGDKRWRHNLDVHDEVIDRHLSKFGGSKIKCTGDGVFAVFDGPTNAARCALELVPALATRNINIRAGGTPANVNAGVTTGVASACTSALASRRSPDRARFSRAEPFETSPRART